MAYGTGGSAKEDIRDVEPTAPRSAGASRGVPPGVWLLAACAAGLVVALSRSSSAPVVGTEVLAASESAVSGNAFSIHSWNEYRYLQNKTDEYPYLYGIDDAVLVEPHKNHTFEIRSPNPELAYEWVIADSVGETRYVGASIEATVFSSGMKVLTVTQSVGSSSYFQTYTLYCKYVRRELRTLTASDRSDFLDAARTLWETSTVEGRELYGERYRDIYSLAIIHNDLAGNQYCDFIHGAYGYAFINAHAALNGMLEQAMQAVHPAVALPYWAYTLDDWQQVERRYGGVHASSTTERDLLNLWDSAVFTSRFFGASDAKTGVIADGQWARSKVPVMSRQLFSDSGFSGRWLEGNFATCYGQSAEVCPKTVVGKLGNMSEHQRNSFGLLRSPWNMRAESTIVRSRAMCGIANNGQFPDCNSYLQQQAAYTSFADYMIQVQVSPHGTVHVFTGGAFGDCSESYPQLALWGLNATEVWAIQYKSSDIQKNMWMGGYKTCPDSSECAGLDQDECSCGCPALADLVIREATSFAISNSTTWQAFLSTVYSKDSTDESDVKAYEAIDNLDAKSKIEILKIVCETDILTGDMLGSNSPLDITFFATHAEVERLWQRMALSGNLTDMTWPTEVNNCPGQHPAYKTVWFDYQLDQDRDSTQLTNVEWRDMLNPANPDYALNIPYVYDDFQWDHCTKANPIEIKTDATLMLPTDWVWNKDKTVAPAIAQAVRDEAKRNAEIGKRRN